MKPKRAKTIKAWGIVLCNTGEQEFSLELFYTRQAARDYINGAIGYRVARIEVREVKK